jgi:AcrR family transcriptional regulator
VINRRDEIADMFKKYFHHYGFKKTSVDDVSGELHISKKTIYEYFESKESVFAFIIQREAAQAMQKMARHLESIPSAIEKLTLLIHLIFENADTYLKNSRNLDFHDRDEIASLSFQSAYETILKQVVEEGIHAGEFHFSSSDLSLSFVKAIIWQGLHALKDDPSSRPEQPTSATILKLLT